MDIPRSRRLRGHRATVARVTRAIARGKSGQSALQLNDVVGHIKAQKSPGQCRGF
jgi:hypothetical protein